MFGYIYLFERKAFFKESSKLSVFTEWPLPLFALAGSQMTEPTEQGRGETEKWRKELISPEDQTTQCRSRAGGWTARGALMSLKMFPQLDTSTPDARDPPRRSSCPTQSPGKLRRYGQSSSVERTPEQAIERYQHQYLVELQSYSN